MQNSIDDWEGDKIAGEQTDCKCTKLAIACYGLGDLASQFVWTFVGSYLTIYYTDVVGFAPATVAVIMLIARIFDAVNDPLMGSIAENTRTKFGRFRPYVAFGCPFLAIFSVLTFVNIGTGPAGVIFSAVVYILAGVLYTLVNIPYSSLSAVMTEDPDQRNLLGVSRNIGMNVGMVIVSSASAGLALFFSGSGAEVANGQGYLITAVVYAAISIPLYLVVFFTSKEIIIPPKSTSKLSLAQTLVGMVKNKYLMIVFIVLTVQMTAFMGRISVTSYYVIYCLGSYTLIAVVLTIPSIGGVVGSFFVAPLSRKFGRKRTLAFMLVGMAVGLLIVYLSSFENMVMIIGGHIIYGLFNCGFPICLALIADCVDYWEDKTGVRQDGSYYGACGLATKLGNAIGSALGILAISAFGYIANAEQSAATQAGINFTVNLVPAILLIVAAIALMVFWDKSDEDFDKIRESAKEKRLSSSSD